MQTAITIILVIGGLIFFHELGHFLIARLCKVGVSKFSLGLGPRLAGITRGKTHYQVAAIPLGGYVMLVGEQPGEELPDGFTHEESFAAHPTWQKLLIVAAGPVFNLLLAWIIAWGLFWHYGETTILPEIGSVQAESPAEAAGLKPGDIILQIDGQAINSLEKITPIIYNSKGRPIDVVVERRSIYGTEELSVTLQAKQYAMDNILGRSFNNWIIGIGYPDKDSLTINTQHFGFIDSAWLGLLKVWSYIEGIGYFLKDLVKFDVETDALVGPIGIGQIIAISAEQGLSSVLELTLFISINLAILNLLPIPMLDGGHIAFFMFEMVTRRKLPDKFKEAALKIGLLILLSLMGLAIFNDVMGLIQK